MANYLRDLNRMLRLILLGHLSFKHVDVFLELLERDEND